MRPSQSIRTSSGKAPLKLPATPSVQPARPCDRTGIALMHAWNMQDVLRNGQDGIAFA